MEIRVTSGGFVRYTRSRNLSYNDVFWPVAAIDSMGRQVPENLYRSDQAASLIL